MHEKEIVVGEGEEEATRENRRVKCDDDNRRQSEMFVKENTQVRKKSRDSETEITREQGNWGIVGLKRGRERERKVKTMRQGVKGGIYASPDAA